MRRIANCLLVCLFVVAAVFPAWAGPFKKLEKPSFSERWFGIYVDNERVGFYHQEVIELPDGYRFEGDGSVRMKVMGFSKEASMRESYQVAKNLTLRSFDVEQTVNGVSSRVSGKVSDTRLKVKNKNNGKTSEKIFRFKGDLFPGPALNVFPLMRDVTPGKSYKVATFDAEEVKVKDVKITVLGEENTPDGQPAIKLRNDLYPFVSNDIWVDSLGNTLLESVRDGLVTTRAETPRQLGGFISDLAISKKDLIYDFSLVRIDPPLKDQSRLTGLVVEISGWADTLPLLQEGGQAVEKIDTGRIIVRTGSAVPPLAVPAAQATKDSYLKSAEKIEAAAPEIVAKAREIAGDRKEPREIAQALSAWTADWLKDTIEDGGGALTSLKERSGNCQTHARLYTALARSRGISTRFVSGLVYQQGKGFLYHSWAESYLVDRWVAIDPTYNQLPADPTHLKFFEGHTLEDMAPIVAIIGRIKISVQDAKYN